MQQVYDTVAMNDAWGKGWGFSLLIHAIHMISNAFGWEKIFEFQMKFDPHLAFIPNDVIDSKSLLIQVMAWSWKGEKTILESIGLWCIVWCYPGSIML